MTRRPGIAVMLLMLAWPWQTAVARGPDVPSGVPQRRAEILQQARKTWRRDAEIVSIRLNWSPQAYRIPPETFWLDFELYSPSNRHRAFVSQLHGDDDNEIHETDDFAADINVDRPVPEFAIDLPTAITIARKAGMKESVSQVMLSVDEPTGHKPVLAWLIYTARRDFPYAIEAQTGRELTWQEVLNPPRWTDEEIQTAMYRFIHRNDPPPPGGGGGGGGCFSGVEVMYGMCMNSGGSYVDPVTGH